LKSESILLLFSDNFRKFTFLVQILQFLYNYSKTPANLWRLPG
jgi:hypothetical protein